MRWSFLIVFFTLSLGVLSQEVDSLKRKEHQRKLEKSSPDAEEKESFGDFVQKVGLGLWGQVKERLNLNGLVENLEEKKDKFMGDKPKNESPKKEEKKDEKRSTNDP
jgi:hypothetical protein